MRLFAIADNRVCYRCGARAGACPHLARMEGEFRPISEAHDKKIPKDAWSAGEIVGALVLRERGLSADAIAERLGRSPSAVKYQLWAHRIRRAELRGAL